MIESRQIPVLAVDGGGTRCRVAIQREGEVIAVETGSANLSSDFDGTVAEILGGLAALSSRADMDMDDLVRLPAFVGLAGVTGPTIAERLRIKLPLTRLRIEDDRPAAVRGALGARDGLIAHCGTGSFFAGQSGSKMVFSGGWGPVLGDEASAQWVGRTALMLTLEAADGRRACTGLAAALLEHYDGPAGIVHFGGRARAPQFGAIAPMVTERAAKGDDLAAHIMSLGAAEIVRSLSHLGWAAGRCICLTGGIGPQFEPYLPAAMQADVVLPKGEPLMGALSLARALQKETRA
ncbi:MAG: ATPase [Rhodobacteraceae bacterium]|nr:ATPase [Paracoccaceae bacterium]